MGQQNVRYQGTIPNLFISLLFPVGILYIIYQGVLLRWYPSSYHLPLNERAHNIVMVSKPYTDRKKGSEFDNMVRDMLSNSGGEEKSKLDNVVNLVNILQNQFDEISKTSDAKIKVPQKQNRTFEKKLGPKVADPMPESMKFPSKFNNKIKEKLEYEYNVKEKLIPHVGHKDYLSMFNPEKLDKLTPHYLNSVVVVPGYDANHLHGRVGVTREGFQWWNPAATPPECDAEECKKRRHDGGGFDLLVSDSKPLDRDDSIDYMVDICQDYTRNIDITTLDDISVIITFYNEHLSTLLRTVHSVLNNTPPPLLHEILLVDDGSDMEVLQPGRDLDDALKYLPKVKLLRQPIRRGLVMGRIAGIQNSLGKVAVILDSHVEVNKYWMEPLLQRIVEEPAAVVMPVIASLDSTTLEPSIDGGIGTWLSWRWNMVEQATFGADPKTIDPVPSASMGGGLFAMRRDWFFELGGYDEKFSMWGAENVELPFRVWLCGGRLEGIPCSLTYHIYRKDGSGYSSPGDSVVMNRLRTARLWMDEYYQVARFFIFGGKIDKEKENNVIGPLDEMLKLKQDLKCKPFKWYFDNVDQQHDGRDLEKVILMGMVITAAKPDLCLDTLSGGEGSRLGLFRCHGNGGSQAFYHYEDDHTLKLAANPKTCLKKEHEKKELRDCAVQHNCTADDWHLISMPYVKEVPENITKIPETYDKEFVLRRIVFKDKNHPEYGESCLTAEIGNKKEEALKFAQCVDGDISQYFWVEPFKSDPDFYIPTISPQYLVIAE